MRSLLPVIVLAATALGACQPANPAPRPTPARAVSVPSAAPARRTTLPTRIAAPTPTRSTQHAARSTLAPAPAAAFFDDRRLSYEPGFYAREIQAFLDERPGRLKSMAFRVGDRTHTFAEALAGQAAYYSVNPKVILALLELHGGLISNPTPSPEQVGWAAGYRGEGGIRRGVQAQVRWAIKQILYARRDYPAAAPLSYADGAELPPPAGMTLSEYAIARVLAPTALPGQVLPLMERFLEVYTRLFEDPRPPPPDWPAPAAPFLSRPTEKVVPVTSFFDHGGPFLTRDDAAGVITYWGHTETDRAFAYNGHDGWDYAAAPPDRAIAAADGEVVFAGNADDGCATRAVVIDHGNGYRTLYWHLHTVGVEIGERVARGQRIGMIGNSGCSTGPHLHFGVQYLGRNTDPYGWCGAGQDPWGAHPAGAPSVWLWADRPSPCGPPPPGAALVDTTSPGFVRDGEGWQEVASGYGGRALFIPSVPGAEGRDPWELRPLTPPAVAVWRPALQAPGRYRVLAYIPYALSGLEDPRHMHYRVRHAGGEAEVVVDAQLHANDWADLGVYDFAPGDTAVVLSSAAEGRRLSVWVDAIIWLPIKR
ncbi:MAG TPA: peptidoglycan DD-metalloendopeptidase family protein [Roseiflexaceae bacterium]|nr:peptidoglycan DD-metalloendopeptidase family protein [Roseiflexaceae bacterium]